MGGISKIVENEGQPYCLISEYKLGALEVLFELLRVTCKPVTLQQCPSEISPTRSQA